MPLAATVAHGKKWNDSLSVAYVFIPKHGVVWVNAPNVDKDRNGYTIESRFKWMDVLSI